MSPCKLKKINFIYLCNFKSKVCSRLLFLFTILFSLTKDLHQTKIITQKDRSQNLNIANIRTINRYYSTHSHKDQKGEHTKNEIIMVFMYSQKIQIFFMRFFSSFFKMITKRKDFFLSSEIIK